MANRNQGSNQGNPGRSGTSNRGFASMDAAQQREIARMGGEAVSENRSHMAEIGRKGGEASAESRAQQRAARSRTGADDMLGEGTRTTAAPTADADLDRDINGASRVNRGNEDAGDRSRSH